MINTRKAELLAPAGSFDSLKAAVAAGADAIYMGGSRFGARAYAQNAAGEEMVEAIRYAHLHGFRSSVPKTGRSDRKPAKRWMPSMPARKKNWTSFVIT